MSAESVRSSSPDSTQSSCADTAGHINRYPGVACDVPSHTYQYTFCENTQWSAFYAPGSEIQAYLAKVAEHYDIRKLIKVCHRVISRRGSHYGELTISCHTK